MYMKIIIKLMILAVCISSCNNWFDEELPKYQVSASTVVVDQESAETALLGVYSYLGEYGTFSAYYLVDDAYRCGLLEGTYRGQDYERYLELLDVPSESSELLKKWKECGQIINAANNLLSAIDKVDDAKFVGNRKSEIMAEARFMRAFAQLYLLKHFAFWWDQDSPYGALMRREPGTLANNLQKRATVKESYDWILEDLDFVIDNGPDFTSVYRASKGLAKAYKIECLLMRGHMEDYTQVIQLADEVILNYGFEMEKNYEDVFNNGYDSKELMFSRYLSEKKLADVDMNVPSIKKLMCGKYKPNDQFKDIFNEENDSRYVAAFDSVLYEQINTQNKTLILKKIWRSDGNSLMYYMRLAQMYLFKAEALAMSGASVSDVIVPLNFLRSRSGNVPYEDSQFQERDELIKAIFYEVIREIGLENGSEWFAAARMKLAGGRRLLQEFNSVYKDDKQMAWQIPDDEIKYNTLMEPNPVYTNDN